MPRRENHHVRKRGNHTEHDMRRAIELIKSGMSIRQATKECQLRYSTVRRYVKLLNENQGKVLRLTPNYEVNRIFNVEEEQSLVQYFKYLTKQFKEKLSSKDCRRVAFEMAKIIQKKIPQAWVKDNKAGIEWFRSFKLRHPGVSVRTHKAGDLVRETVLDRQDMEIFFGHLKCLDVATDTVKIPEERSIAPTQKTFSEVAKVAQALPTAEAKDKDPQPGPSTISDTTVIRPLVTNAPPRKGQDPLSRVIEQCRFCGEFSKECIPVKDKPYLSVNKTTLAFNEIGVQLDFNDDSRPKTVCQDCDAKLQEMFDFVQVVKTAQNTLINKSEKREEIETLVVKTECDDEESESSEGEERKDIIVDSVTLGETVFVKESLTHKRKNDKSPTAKSKKTKTKDNENENSVIIDIKQEIIETDDDNDGYSVTGDTRHLGQSGHGSGTRYTNEFRVGNMGHLGANWIE